MMAWDVAERVLQRVCERFLRMWDRAVGEGAPPPDAWVLLDMIEERDVNPPGFGLALEYVGRCLSNDNKRPEQKALMANLMLRGFRGR